MEHSFWPDRFKGQAAVVTGGASGLGLGIARRLAKEGANVMIVDLKPDSIEEALDQFANEGLAITGRVADVTDPASIAEAFQLAFENNEHLDVVVNSAGVVGYTGPTENLRLDEFQRVLHVNLTGTFLVNQAALKYMIPARYGRILNIASIAGVRGNPMFAAYAASKGGVIALTKALGKEYADHNTYGSITVNCLAPTTVDTPMVRSMPPERVAYMKSQIPAGALGTVESVAETVAFHVSRTAFYITGRVLDHSGGANFVC